MGAVENAGPGPGWARRWQTPSLVACACSDCGAHAYRRLGPDDAGPVDPTGTPATCTVCCAGALLPLDVSTPALAG